MAASEIDAQVIIPLANLAGSLNTSTAAEPGPGETAHNAANVYIKGEEVYLASTHRVYSSLRGDIYPCSISAASPAKIGFSGLVNADGVPYLPPDATPIAFRNTGGALPTGLTANTVYFTKNASAANQNVEVAATPGGTSINTTGGSGTQYAILYPNKGNSPDTSPIWWYDERPTNKYAVFDEMVDTPTVLASPFTMTFNNVMATGFSALGLVGTNLYVKAMVGATIVYEENFPLDGSLIGDDYDYFFAPFRQKRDVSKTEIPPYTANWTFTLTGDANVQMGALVLGTSYRLGILLVGAKSGYLNFSDVRTNEVTQKGEIVRRRRVRSVQGTLKVDAEDVDYVTQLSEDLDGELAVYILAKNDNHRSVMTLYGLPSDFTGTHTEHVVSEFSLAIRGF